LPKRNPDPDPDPDPQPKLVNEHDLPGADAQAATPLSRQARHSVTMADVAARVGVSKMSVSRALSRGESRNRSDSEALRQRILAACRDMGYVIDQTARTFSSQRSGFVAALIPALNNSNFSDTAHGLTAAVEARGLQLLLGYTDYDVHSEERLLKAMLARRPEGVIVTGGSHTALTRTLLESAAVPVVETWDLLSDPIEHNVGFSNAEATGELVRHLHAKGYRRLAFMGGVPGSDARGADRRRGFEAAVQALGLPAGRTLSIGHAPVSMAHGAQGVVELLQRWPDVDAVVCVSDHAAFGALMECQRRGWAVPQRLAIAGFGGFEVGAACHPRLTTVAVDCVGIGQAAGELLLRAIQVRHAGDGLPPETVSVPFRIEAREST